MSRAQITDSEKIRKFVTAGKARMTLVSKKTGARFTYQLKEKKKDGKPTGFFFVSVLTGPDNTSSYTYLGCVTNGQFRDDRSFRIGAQASSRFAFNWFWDRLQGSQDLSQCEVWHEGRCGRCGRVLTVPESIETGLGPVCAGR